MPIYEYRCSSCGHRFDVRQSFSDEPGAACPTCQAAAQRVLQPVGIVFKGSGWYSTAYRSSRSSGSNGTSSGSESTGSSESKSEAQTEEKKIEAKAEQKKSETSTASTTS